MKKLFVFLGPPGSGKGSLSALCVKRLGWQQLSTGNLCREHIAAQTTLGKEIDLAIKSGKLISDSLIIQMANEWLKKTFTQSGTVIFDGFPRTVPQAKALHELVDALPDVHMNIVRMEIELEKVVNRLLTRAICQNKECQMVYSVLEDSTQLPRKPMMCNECDSPLVRRSDDEEKAIYERLKIYQSHESALCDFYERVNQPLYSIQADLPLEKVYDKLLGILGIEHI